MQKKLIASIIALSISCLFSVAYAGGVSQGEIGQMMDIYTLARAHSQGKITLTSEEITSIENQGYLALERAFQKINSVSDADMAKLETRLPQKFAGLIMPIINNAKLNIPADEKIKNIVTASSDCTTYTYVFLAGFFIAWIPFTGFYGAIISLLASLIGYVSFWAAIFCLLGII